MTPAAQPVTFEQLAKLYAAANLANSELATAMRAKPRDREVIEYLRQRSRELNSAYDAARRAHKKQQKSERRADMQVAMIRFYLDSQESHT
jgi:hypothetical protein